MTLNYDYFGAHCVSASYQSAKGVSCIQSVEGARDSTTIFTMRAQCAKSSLREEEDVHRSLYFNLLRVSGGHDEVGKTGTQRRETTRKRASKTPGAGRVTGTPSGI